MLRTPRHPDAPPHPDAACIAGISAALVINAALLLLLSRPIELAYPTASPQQTPPLQAYEPKPVEVVRIEKPHPAVHAAQATQPQQHPVITQKATNVSIKADPQPDPVAVIAQPLHLQIDATGGVPIEASLAYLDASPPPYPRSALRDGIEGTVHLRVLVDETGHVLDVQIERSSGDHQLDIAAREQVLRHWLFQPAQRNGVAMRAWGIVPIDFRLDGR